MRWTTCAVSAAARPRPRASGWVQTALTSGRARRAQPLARHRQQAAALLVADVRPELERAGPERPWLRHRDQFARRRCIVGPQLHELEWRLARPAVEAQISVEHHLEPDAELSHDPASWCGQGHGTDEEHDAVRPGEIGQVGPRARDRRPRWRRTRSPRGRSGGRRPRRWRSGSAVRRASATPGWRGGQPRGGSRRFDAGGLLQGVEQEAQGLADRDSVRVVDR